jgi:uncharacterized protein
MSEEAKPAIGSLGWVDLTVSDAPGIRDFYAAVTGWKPAPVAMGEYSDYTMNEPESGKSVAGVCHARGDNADLPAQWLVYVVVASLEGSLAECRARGGVVVAGPKTMGHGAHFAVIRDPAGAVLAPYQAPSRP